MGPIKVKLYETKLILFFFIISSLFNCDNDTNNDSKFMIEYLPKNTEIIFHLPNLKDAKKLFKENVLQDDFASVALKLITHRAFNSSSQKKDSKDSFESLLCFSKTEDNQYTYTLLSKLNNNSNTKEQLIKTDEITNASTAYKTIYSSEKDQILISSFSKSNIEEFIKNNHHNSDESLKKAYLNSKKMSTNSIIIKGDKYNDIFNRLFTFYDKKEMNFFKDWVTLKINHTNEKLNLSSQIPEPNTNNSLLNIFDNTVPRTNKAAEIIPTAAQGFASYSYDNYSIFKGNIAHLEINKNRILPNTLDDLLLHCHAISYITFEKENALILSSNDIYAIIEKYQTRKVHSLFNIDIIKFEFPKTLEKTLYPLISTFDANYYFTYKNFIVFANNISLLKLFIMDIKNKNTYKYQKFFANNTSPFSDSTSVYIFKNPKYKNLKLEDDIALKNPNLSTTLTSILNYSSSINFNKHKSTNFTKAKITLNKIDLDLKNKTTHLTKLKSIKIESELLNDPILVKNSLRKEMDILVQDKNHQLNLLSKSGDLLWKKKLDGPIIGKIHQLEFKGKKEFFFAFNTETSLYLIDNFGNYLKNFPKELEKPATQALAVINYGENKNYRFIITHGNKIRSYNAQGNIINGFFRLSSKGGNYTKPPKYIRLKSKESVVLQEENGELNIIGHKGDKLISLKKRIPLCKNEWYRYKEFIVSTNTKGYLAKIDKHGKVTYENLNLDDPDHKFMIFNEIIISLSNHTLSIGDQKVLLDKEGFYTAPKPLLINDRLHVSITNLKSKKLYLYDEFGVILPKFPVAASSSMNSQIKMDINKDSSTDFIVKGDKNEIILYKI